MTHNQPADGRKCVKPGNEIIYRKERLVMFLQLEGDGGASVHSCFRSRENP